MPRWGLVIGSGFDDPRGVENDTRLIGQALTAHGFAVETLLGPRATRAQILGACDAILAAAGPEDAVAIYYAGHGALVTDPGRGSEGAEGTHTVRALCPSDYGESTDDDFRGIASIELSSRLSALAARTGNVTAILDCGYTAPLCRGAGGSGRRARAVQHASRLAVSRHLRGLAEGDARRQVRGGPVANASEVVRIAATRGSGGAFPVRLPAMPRWLARGRGRGGDGFVGALTLALCELLHEIGDDAMPWAAILPALRRRVRAHGDGQQPAIEGAIRRVPFERIERDPSRELRDGAVAVVGELAHERRAVRIIAREPDGARIAAALAATGRLQVSRGAEPDILAEIELRGDRLVIRDREELLFDPVPYPVGLGDAASDLANLALVQRLRGLPEEQGVARSDVELVWGTVVGGAEQPRPDHGFALGLDDVIYVRAKNLSAGALYAHVFHIGPRGRIALLSSFELPPQQERTLGADIDEQLRGIPVVWPLGLARSAPGLDALLAIFTAAPTDLHMLDSSAQRVVRAGRIELGAFAVVWCDYWLFPLRARLATADFEIDDKPFGVRAIAPCAAAARNVRLRLRDIEMPGNGPGGRMRIDVLVCTRARPGALPYRARTLRLPDGGRPQRLALTDDVLWCGLASDLLDVYVWASRDEPGAADLADLLRLGASGARLRDAVAALCDGAAPRAASIASAASTAIASVAGDLLARATRDVTGVYRGSLAIPCAAADDRPTTIERCHARRLAFALALELECQCEHELEHHDECERDLAIARLPSDSNRRPTAYEAVATTS